MNHQPFENWLLDNQPLNPGQKRELQDHLKDCTSCSAITELDLALTRSRMIEPGEGFSSRFHLRLEAERSLRRKKVWWGIGLISVLVLISLVMVTFFLIRTEWISPTQLIVNYITWWLSLFTSFQVVTDIGMVLLKVLVGSISLPIWFGIAVGGSLLVFGWVLSIWKLSFSPQARRLT